MRLDLLGNPCRRDVICSLHIKDTKLIQQIPVANTWICELPVQQMSASVPLPLVLLHMLDFSPKHHQGLHLHRNGRSSMAGCQHA